MSMKHLYIINVSIHNKFIKEELNVNNVDHLYWNNKPIRMSLVDSCIFSGLCSGRISADDLIAKFMNGKKDDKSSKVEIDPMIITAYIYEYDDHISIENILVE